MSVRKYHEEGEVHSGELEEVVEGSEEQRVGVGADGAGEGLPPLPGLVAVAEDHVVGHLQTLVVLVWGEVAANVELGK